MNILIAPNAFKHSLDARAAADAIALGFAQSRLDCTCKTFPVGDGGDGTGSLLIDCFAGRRISVSVQDALGRAIISSFGLIADTQTAVIEMADAAGIRLLQKTELNPLKVTSFGTGQMISAALDAGAKQLVIGMGGSATVDGGMGILRALGVCFLNAAGQELTTPDQLIDLKHIDLSGVDKRAAGCAITILCDVDNLLLGNAGAAAVFGPQKGALPQDVALLDAALTRFAGVVLQQTGIDMAAIKHGGTAGGAAVGLYALLNAKLVSGGEYFLQLTNFDAALREAQLVITGEGSIDEQTLQGKAPFAVAHAAKQYGLPVIGLAGRVPIEPSETLNSYFDMLLAIGNEPTDLSDALKNTHANLVRSATALGNLLHTLRL